ncbi:MAG: hypothetical protein KAT00_05725 [Planctomycetes bacterium]|nr:hypothetical protein [Planctomycetota bacterium]
MSVIERRRKYVYNRILIESSRILSPQFDDAVVYLTGAQVELLRNVSQYLSRRDTYVATYYPGYYLVPTEADMDDIREIVADLEETLMGNPNTIWGFKDVFTQLIPSTRVAIESVTLNGLSVPAGYVRVITSIAAYYTTGTCDKITLRANQTGGVPRLEHTANPSTDVPVVARKDIVLQEAEYISAVFNVTVQPCQINLDVQGYDMAVPT